MESGEEEGEEEEEEEKEERVLRNKRILFAFVWLVMVVLVNMVALPSPSKLPSLLSQKGHRPDPQLAYSQG